MTWNRLLLAYLTVRRGLTAALFLTAAFAAAVDVLFPWFLQEAIDAALGGGESIGFGWAVGGMAAAGVAAGVGHGLAIWIESRLFSRASADLRRQLILNCFEQPLGVLQQYHSAELVHRVSSSVGLLEQTMVELFSEMPFALFVAAGVLVMMLFSHARLTLLVVGLLIAAGIINERLAVRLPGMQRLGQILSAGLARTLQESLAAMRILKAHGAEAMRIEQMESANRRMFGVDRASGNLRALTVPIWGSVQILAIVLVLAYGGRLLMSHEISVGTLVAFIAYVELLAVPVNRAGEFYYQLLTCQATAQRIAAILGKPQPPAAETGFSCDAGRAPIVLDDVRFSYCPGKKVYDGLTLAVAPGEATIVVGRNGAGKSTLLDLLLGFQLPDAGRIEVGGVDLRSWDIDSWRGQVGIVPQDSLLLSGTIAENVALGAAAASREQIRQALEQAGGTDWFARFPEGIDTLVGERGTHLSGGERQIIALARVFLRDSRIVLLDEPTAHLDGEILLRVDDALRRLMQGRTVIFISHRPATMRLASRIALLERGRIVDQGSHADLWERSALYRELLTSTQTPQLSLVPVDGQPLESAM